MSLSPLSTSVPLRVVAEITLTVDSSGTTETFYAATTGFTTTPSDTPPNTYIAPRLTRSGGLRRELFSGARVFGGVRPAFGELVLSNIDGGISDWAAYASSGGSVVVRVGEEGAAYPGGYELVFQAYTQNVVATWDTVRIRLRDRLQLLDQPLLTSGFSGAGGLEGSTGIAGALKQWVSEDPYLSPVQLVDRTTQLYYVQSTSPGSLSTYFKLYEGGVEIARDADYANSAALLSSAPSLGHCGFYFGPVSAGPVYVRLHTAPVFDLRVSSFGYKPTGTPFLLPDLAELAGITGGTGSVSVGALHVDDDRTIGAVMDSACAWQLGYYYMTRDDAFVCGTFTAPTGASAYTFTPHNARNWARQVVDGMDVPVWRLMVSSGKRWPGNVANSATDQMRDECTRQPWWSAWTREDAAIKTANPGATVAKLQIEQRAFQNTMQQDTFADSYLALFGQQRSTWACTVPLNSTTLDIELHDVVTVAPDSRFGLGAGIDARVISQSIDLSSMSITYQMWA